ALFLWMVAHQVMPSTWTFYTKFRFGWSEMMIGASLAAAGVVMAGSQATLMGVLGPRPRGAPRAPRGGRARGCGGGSEAPLMRVLGPRLGEPRPALAGIAVASVGYLGYGMATASWMMFA